MTELSPTATVASASEVVARLFFWDGVSRTSRLSTTPLATMEEH